MKLVIASDNAHKLREFRQILGESGIELLSKTEAGCTHEVEETGETFEENAYIKARAVMEKTGLPSVADDSGLCVDALGGAPGVHSARFSGRHDDPDSVRYMLLLEKLRGVSRRSARFVCCICCAFPEGGVIRARGECRGSILLAPKGDNGFGYDPVFQPEGYGQSMAELGPDIKNAIGHRGMALRRFKTEWERYYADK